jgi:plastocyanin
MTLRTLVAVSILSAPTTAAADPGSVRGTVVAEGLSHNGDIVVSLEQQGLATTPPAEPVQVDQHDFEFVPHVTPVVVGTTVRYLNSDDEAHNVYSPEGRYNLGTWPPGEHREHSYDEPGVYTQLCRVHPDMLAFIVVLDTPYFAKTTEQGEFVIEGVPPGTYTLVAWSEELDPLEQEIVVESGKTLSLELTLGP